MEVNPTNSDKVYIQRQEKNVDANNKEQIDYYGNKVDIDKLAVRVSFLGRKYLVDTGHNDEEIMTINEFTELVKNAENSKLNENKINKLKLKALFLEEEGKGKIDDEYKNGNYFTWALHAIRSSIANFFNEKAENLRAFKVSLDKKLQSPEVRVAELDENYQPTASISTGPDSINKLEEALKSKHWSGSMEINMQREWLDRGIGIMKEEKQKKQYELTTTLLNYFRESIKEPIAESHFSTLTYLGDNEKQELKAYLESFVNTFENLLKESDDEHGLFQTIKEEELPFAKKMLENLG